jgi:hypothetical protein
MMTLPFSHDAFLDVFGAYNTIFWPAEILLWIATAAVVLGWIVRRYAAGTTVFALLAAHWIWSGIGYHWLFFRAINPAASVFAAGFVLQGALFAWLAAAARGHVRFGIDLRGVSGAALAAYGLVYPALGLLFGLQYPRVPVFAVPCPTTLITAGLLLNATEIPRWTGVIPLLWAIIGSTAAFALGIRADVALVAAAAALLVSLR